MSVAVVSARMRLAHAALLAVLTGLLVLAPVGPAFSHPGRTASDGCHYCRTNCAKWGEVQDQRHCHGGGSSSSGSGSTSSPPPPPPPPADTTPPPSPKVSSPSIKGSRVTLTTTAEDGSLIRLLDTSGAAIASARATGAAQAIQVTLPDGDHKLQITATDAAGNVSSPRAVNLTVDTTPPAAPQLTVSTPPSPTKPWTIFEIVGEARARWTLEIDGARKTGTLPASGKGAVELLLKDGDYPTSALLTDGHGNISAASRDIVIVAVPSPAAPVLAVLSEPGATPVIVHIDGVPEGQAIVEARGGSSLRTRVDLDADGQGVAEFELPDGQHAIAARVSDFQGRESSATELDGVLVDVTPPALQVNIDEGLLREGRLAWSLISESGARIRMSGAEGLPTELVLSGTTDGGDIELPSGEYEIRVVAADAFGHEAEELLNVRVEAPGSMTEALLGLGTLAGLMAAAVWGSRRAVKSLRSRLAARRSAA